MADLQKDLLGLQYSSGINIEGIQEQVANLVLDSAHSIDTSISGTVKDGDQPIGGATVKVFDENGNPFRHTVTDENGKYLFEGLPVGTYSVAVALTGYRLSPARSVTLQEGNTLIVDFAMTKDDTLSLGAIAGVVNTVRDGKKIPLGGVKMSLMDSEDQTIAITYTVDDGEFVFYDIADGQYQLLATEQGYMPSNIVTVTIKNGSVVNTTITLDVDDLTHRGTVNGVITNKQGNIVAGCFVGLYQIIKDEDGKETEVLIAHTKTNAQGKYLFGDVAEGNYVVKAKQNI